MKKTCFGCGQLFESNYPHAKFCNKKCRLTPCTECGSLFDNPRRDKKFCSLKCKGNYQRYALLGENNPNFNKRWSNEKRKKLSEKTLKKGDEISKRVKKDWENNNDRRAKASELAKNTIGKYTREKGSFSHTEDSKIAIGIKSKEKYTEEYKIKFRRIMEENGHWVPISMKTDKEIYYSESSWVVKMFDIVDEGNELLKEHGVFNAVNNTKGVVRNHILGRTYGFRHGIFPELLRHPANCRLVLHSENVSKGQRGKGRLDSEITIEDLFNKISDYKKSWFEQDKCISLIKEYKNGKRWNRKEV